MNNIVFADKITAILKDNTELDNIRGVVVNNKRVYYSESNEILTGAKKIKQIKSINFCVLPQFIIVINSLENE